MDLLDSISDYIDETTEELKLEENERERGIEIVNEDTTLEDLNVSVTILRGDGSEEAVEMVQGEFMGAEPHTGGRAYPQDLVLPKATVRSTDVTLHNFEEDENGNVVPSIQSTANPSNKKMQELMDEVMRQEANKHRPKRVDPKRKAKKKLAKKSRAKNRRKK